jgi:hypothetical protein
MLASVGGDRTVGLWDAVTNEALIALDGYGSPIQTPHFSPDGKAIAAIPNVTRDGPREGIVWRASRDETDPKSLRLGTAGEVTGLMGRNPGPARMIARSWRGICAGPPASASHSSADRPGDMWEVCGFCRLF